MGPGTTAARTLHSDSVCDKHLIADAGVLDIEGDHFAQAEADDGNGLSGFGGKGIEVEDEDADDGVGQDDGDGASARRDFVESGADGGGDGFGRAQVGLFNAGNERAGRKRNEGVDVALRDSDAPRRARAAGRAAASTPSGEISMAAADGRGWAVGLSDAANFAEHLAALA